MFKFETLIVDDYTEKGERYKKAHGDYPAYVKRGLFWYGKSGIRTLFAKTVRQVR